MGDWEHVSLKSITCQTEPSCKPLFAIVPNSAQCCVGAMQGQRMNVRKQMFSDFASLVQHATQILDTDPVRGSKNKYDRLIDRKMPAHQERSTDRTTISDHRHFKNAPRGDNPQRDETRLYEIDIFKGPFRLLQNHTSSEDDRPRELPYCREILQGKSR
ncbi:hypothetical protein ACVIGB_008768 [Bradyrhizobium sp. USDA 4341]